MIAKHVKFLYFGKYVLRFWVRTDLKWTSFGAYRLAGINNAYYITYINFGKLQFTVWRQI